MEKSFAASLPWAKKSDQEHKKDFEKSYDDLKPPAKRQAFDSPENKVEEPEEGEAEALEDEECFKCN